MPISFDGKQYLEPSAAPPQPCPTDPIRCGAVPWLRRVTPSGPSHALVSLARLEPRGLGFEVREHRARRLKLCCAVRVELLKQNQRQR